MKSKRITIKFTGTPAQNVADFYKLAEALTGKKYPQSNQDKKV